MKILKIRILIDDINDHSPEFLKNEVQIEFSERESKGTKIPLPNAIDKDISIKNSQITYMIKKNKREPFSISIKKRHDGVSIPELILEDKLDRELKDKYILTLEAKDGGYPPKTATLKVHISVTDVNDNTPAFSQKLYNISISNSHQRHLPILTLKATDQDSGDNGKISYHFNHKTSQNVLTYFVLNEKSGDLFLHDNFHFSKKQSYKLFIEARDGGNPPLSSVTKVQIYIINNQNNAPLINIDFVSPLSESSAAVSEASKIGSFIAYVMVTDTDSGPNGEVICDLKHDKFKLAKIDSKEYKMIVKGHLDREIRDHYKVSIVCHDMGSPQLESKKYFSVKVTDVNDVEPHFTKETFQFLTYENQKVDFPIGFINATDPDLGDGGQLTYSIINDNNNDNIPFQLTKYGFISTSQSIDREMKDIYKFKVLVKDNGTPSLNDTANIVIEILDKNDNAPYFTFPNNDPYNLDVHYHPHSKKDITILRASDKDTGNNAFLTYGILRSNDKNLFTVNSHTGVLSFSRTVYQNDAGTYELQFIVKDGGTPVQSATTAIILTLFVSNDTSPMLTAVPFQSGHDLNMTWVIIIVAAAVILSVAIVVSITLCVFRCINHTNNSPTTAENPNFLSQTEMRQLLYQTNNPVAITRNAEEIFNRNLQTIKSKSQFFLEMEQTPDEWKFSTTQRRLPPVPQRCDSIHSQERRTSSIMSYNSDTLTSQKDREASKSNGKTKPYDEIPAEPEYTNDNPVAATILKGQQIQDTYLQPTYLQYISIPEGGKLADSLVTWTEYYITYHVKEEDRPHTYIGDIAVDSNLSHPLTHQQHTLITFTQLQRTVESGSHLFNVTNSGKLYTTQTLDAESLCTYNKECSRIVKVAVRKGQTFMKILKIKILIQDINDHSPEFPQNEVEIAFSERDSKGTRISLLNAIDKDISIRNSQLKYMIEKSKSEPFSLSVTKQDGIFIPELILEETLDRELQDSYILAVQAKDGGNPPKTTTLKVHISVTDVNDNTPVFSQKVYNISINNSHQRHLPILTLKATDKDSGLNGKISYHFNHKTSQNIQKYFVLNKKTGDLFLDDKFQFTKKQSYKLFIEARDGGQSPKKSVTRVQLHVINNENNAPLINIDFVSPLSESSAAVSEASKIGSFIAYVMVTDTDSGPNGEVICDLKHDKFKLAKIDSKEYKMIVKGHLDREIRDHYKVSIVCHDMGSPQLESKKYFSVKVTDVNDVEPHFTKETFQFLTYENQKVDFPIGFINATDPDLGDGGQLTYSIINDNNNDNIPFQLTKYGFISTSQPIDREMKDIYKFQVLVKDNGTPSLNDTANIVIEILDKNDNAPYFTFPNNDPTISMSTTIHTFIVKDGGTPVQSATTAIILTLFVSNDTTPMLTAVPFQSGHDLNMTWVIIIVAAAVILSVAIVVSITLCVFRCINHTNNSPTTAENPNFLSQTEMRQLLYQTNNPVAITRNAEEIFNRNLQTIKSKSQFFLEMEQTPDEWKFSTTQRRLPPVPQRCDSIHSQGRRTSSIMSYNSDTLTSQKDREASKSNGKTKPYDEIPAEPDMTAYIGLLCLLHLLITLVLSIDITYHVKEEDRPHTYIGDIAVDSNLSHPLTHQQHTLITFTQLQRTVESGSHLFNVTNSGKLYTTQTLDAESLCTYNKECSRIVKVAVRKEETFMKILRIKILIEDINDHSPEFPQNEVEIEFSERDRKGEMVSLLNAIDQDISVKNSQITYIIKKSKREPFSLSLTKHKGIFTPEIILEDRLDREVKDSYMLTLEAKDGGNPPKTATLKVHISVIDVNDNIPVFSQEVYNISIINSHQRHLPILTLKATDQDSGQNGKISFHFNHKTSRNIQKYFALNEKSGDLFLRDNFHFSKKQSYKLFVEARDGGKPPKKTVAAVQINIINNKNTAPLINIDFVSPLSESSAAVSEASKIGSFIAYVMVTDTDSGPNGEVICDLKHDKFKLAKIDSKEYKMIVKGPLDREMRDHYKVSIVCHDMGSPQLESKKYFSVKVTDVNDVEPHFTKETFQFLTYENQKVDFPIGFINATDPDLGDGGQLTYSIINDNNNDNIPFQLTKYGFISTSQSIDREMKDIYKFKVLVKDNGTPSLNDTTNIVIEILDKNDNAPYFTFPNNDPYNLDVHYHPHSKKDITILRASDKDTGNNAFLTYGILRSNDKNLFTVNSHTGVLSFSRTVYQNDAGTYELQFIVKDGGTPVQSVTTAIILTLFVSNDTSPMLTAVPFQSGHDLNMTWVIIIVAAAVILSVAIVVSITLCVFRCINHTNNSPTTAENPNFLSQTEMRQLLYQTNNPVAITRNAEEIFNRNLQTIKSKSQFFLEMEQTPDEWKFSTTQRRLPPVPQRCDSIHSQERRTSSIMSYNSDTLTSQKDREASKSNGKTKPYDEIPAEPEYTNDNPVAATILKGQQIQDTYLQPTYERQDITYHVNEEGRPHTYIGDIAVDSNLSHPLTHQQHTLVTFTQLQRAVDSGSHLFNVTNSGKLYTTQTLDAESLCTYNKECSRIVKVAVRKGKTFMKILKIKILIEDINDHSPEFPQNEVEIEFSEKERKGEMVSLLNAIDQDISVKNSQITYMIKKSKREPFSLSVTKHDGIFIPKLILEDRLDREVKDSYMLILEAKDGGNPPKTATLKVHITVTDVNDNTPVFSQKLYNISVSNSHQRHLPILTLKATDQDSEDNGKISYHFNHKTSRNVQKYFVLDKKTGDLFLHDKFHFSKKQSYKLFIEAMDGGKPPKKSVAAVQIQIINNRNNVPMINIDFVSPLSESSATVSEDSEVDSFIAYVMVTDTDSGPNGEVICDLKHDKFKLAKIDSKEYKMVIKGHLDREIRDHYKVSIVCHDMGSPQLESKKYFSVKVTDVNDVEPHFTKETFQFLTYENQKVDFPIGFINATDPDLGDGGQLTYSIINDNNNDNIPFQLTKYGFISTSQSIDREMKDIYKFKVLVKDNGTPSLNDTANIRCDSIHSQERRTSSIMSYNSDTLTSQKDREASKSNGKTKPYDEIPAEPGPTISLDDIAYHVKEEDRPHTYIGDIAVDSNLSHPLTHQQHTLITFTQLQRTVESGSHLFNVTNSGKLYTTQTLDAESLCTYNKECYRTVKVAVRKGKTFMKILRIKILIEDINDHSPEFPQNEVEIEFLESQFKVTKQDGIFIPELTLADKLDRELKYSYMLTLEAKDGGNPAKTATLKVHISVTDVNDNTPVFSQKLYNITISNSHQRHLPILTLKATDRDSGDNGKISYHFNHKTSQNVQKYFVLDKKTGDLFLHDNFHFSKRQSYKLFIEAQDGGNPPLKTVARVHIYVINNRNAAPLINIDFVSPLSKSSAAVSEDSEVDSFIAYVMVTDNDSGPNVYQNDAGTYELQFIVKDGGTPVQSATTAIILTLFVSNDTSPMLTAVPFQSGHDLNMDLAENPNFLSQTEMRQLLYQTNNPVAITRNAEEIFNRNLQTIKSKSQFFLEMEQTPDEWKFSTTQRRLPPVPQRCDSIHSQGRRTSSIMSYNSDTLTSQKDREASKSNGKTKPYDEIPAEPVYQKTLYTTQTLDAESLCTYNKECSRTVKVAVRKGTTFMKILRIKILIDDINDYSPEFPQNEVEIAFSETDSKGTRISLPNAIDKDISIKNSQITYTIKKSKREPFSLSVTKHKGIFTPEIILEDKLDRELKDSYMLTLEAKDRGNPPKTATLKIHISVTDVNDNIPVFSQEVYNITINSSHQRHLPFLTLKATDQDSGQNGKISFHFNHKTSRTVQKYFVLDKKTGDLFLHDNFHFSKKQSYKLFVEARDGGNPPLSSVTKVQIHIINNQNTAPLINIDFVSPLTESSAAVSEDSEVDSFIAYVMVTDTDSGPNGEVICDLKHDKFKLAKIDSKEYKMIVKGHLDREIRDHYKVSIVCHDMGSPQLESKKYFSVKVTDVNDVEPHFTKETFQFLTYENQKVDFPIGFINATDPDLGDGGQLTYSIINDNNNDNIPFQLTKYGFISTSQPIDREMKDIYKFKVLVKDNGTPSLNDTANIVIEILDKNDNAPYFTFPNNDPYNLDVHYHPHSKKDITILRASDKDTGNNAFLTYGILRSNDKNLFTVNSHTGVLSFSRTVYQNDAGTYELQFIVKDGGTPVQSATTAIILTLFVSNDTSPMLTAVPFQSGHDLNMTWVIIIVAAAVILSVAIVVSITLCVFRCINHTNNSPTTAENPNFLSQTEMRQLLYQTNNPVAITRNAEEIFNRNLQTIKSKSQFFLEMEQTPDEWKFSTTQRRLPPVPQRCDSIHSQGRRTSSIMSYNSDTLTSQKDREASKSNGKTKPYDEIPAEPEYTNDNPVAATILKGQQIQDTYLQPT
ncbi:cadherin-related tumor suppressor-like [Octopus sinensis]|uniref:Cadherin-related tumor suppressor-like n=1 Tax=Octopus sinensis TaxID=2607531 RepID=A0A6P7T350_9MOLL|nr:cadherin-related tumor suppressor-like [Octopus sinensis]